MEARGKAMSGTAPLQAPAATMQLHSSVGSAPILGVFGGSGFYQLNGGVERKAFDTPYGKPSGELEIAEVAGKRIAFLPRHGPSHSIPPHKINYRANVHAMAQAGVKQILSPFACGSLSPSVKPGEFVVVDQFVDRTRDRRDTFFDGPQVVHVAGAEPYCPRLRKACIASARRAGIRVHESGTVVVIQGPRFSTRAESKWFSQQGWHVITMTQYPEVVLAREQRLCYAGIGLVTDYDAGLEGHPGLAGVTAVEIVKVFNENSAKLAKFLSEFADDPALECIDCQCAKAVDEGRIH